MLKYARIGGKWTVVKVVREFIAGDELVVLDPDGIEHLVHPLWLCDERPGEF